MENEITNDMKILNKNKDDFQFFLAFSRLTHAGPTTNSTEPTDAPSRCCIQVGRVVEAYGFLRDFLSVNFYRFLAYYFLVYVISIPGLRTARYRPSLVGGGPPSSSLHVSSILWGGSDRNKVERQLCEQLVSSLITSNNHERAKDQEEQRCK